jgi:predicted glutamine amidotransferase
MEENLKIEILFPEFCNLYGDISNMKYLKKCLPNANFIETAFDEEPSFVKEKVNFIYLGPMTENMQEKVITKLKPYKERIEELIEENVIFLITGNAIEIFGKYIENEDGSKIEALGIFDIYAKRDMLHRHNSIFIGKWESIDIVGFKSQFTFAYGNNEENYFAKVEKGIGLNKESKLEGIMKNNFIGTYLIGPILILNPLFTEKLLEKMGVNKENLAYAEDVKAAYNQRLEEFKRL